PSSIDQPKGEKMIIEGDQVHQNLHLHTEVLVVGSGCGGAVVAAELAEAGHEVIILEEGGYFPPQVYNQFTPAQALREMYFDYGGIPVIGKGDTPIIFVQAGRAVGGSSLVNGGVCFRTPEYVLETWHKKVGLTTISPKTMEPIFERIEKELRVQPVDEKLHNKGLLRLIQAAKKNRWSGHTIQRNVDGCEGKCRCMFGCPNERKQSVLITYLKRAQKYNATIYADCRVEKILLKRGKAIGVKGKILDRKSRLPRLKFQIHAKTIVLAAGSLGTPLLLQKSKLAKKLPQVGKNLTLHPASRVYGLFDTPVNGWQGAFQSYVIDHFKEEGIKLISIFPAPGVIAATLPGVRQKHWEHMRHFSHLSAFGTMISDVSSGKIGRALGFFPVITYKMKPEDKSKLLRGIQLIAQLYFDAGARKVYLPIFQHPVVENRKQLEEVFRQPIRAKGIECASQHPLGTCRMGTSPHSSVVNEFGQVHHLPNLFLADGSIVPTSVAVNPQITVMALAMKVAEHLKNHLRQPSLVANGSP
ncbi:MAG: GMC family oxidoreductase, partial [Planctomycetota bacterium]